MPDAKEPAGPRDTRWWMNSAVVRLAFGQETLVAGAEGGKAPRSSEPDPTDPSQREFGDFELRIDWRLKETTGFYDVPYVLPDGSTVKGPDGKNLTHPMPNADSGIYLRGMSKYQLNIWCWPIGSGGGRGSWTS